MLALSPLASLTLLTICPASYIVFSLKKGREDNNIKSILRINSSYMQKRYLVLNHSRYIYSND